MTYEKSSKAHMICLHTCYAKITYAGFSYPSQKFDLLFIIKYQVQKDGK